MNYELGFLINIAGVSCSSSSGGQMMGSFGYGAVTMETKFRVSTYISVLPLCPKFKGMIMTFP